MQIKKLTAKRAIELLKVIAQYQIKTSVPNFVIDLVLSYSQVLNCLLCNTATDPMDYTYFLSYYAGRAYY